MRRAITTAAALAAFLGSAASANAGIYTVYSCQGTKGQIYGTAGWVPLKGRPAANTAKQRTFNTCTSKKNGSLGGMLKGGTSHAAGSYVGWRFQTAPNTEIVDYEIYRSADIAGASGDALPSYRHHWPRYLVEDRRENCTAPGCTGVGSQTKPFASSNRLEPTAKMNGVRELFFAARCGGKGTCKDGDSPKGTNTARFDVWGAEIKINDPAGPVLLGPPSGQLANSTEPVSGVTTLVLPLGDGGGGVASVELEVDGQSRGRFPVSRTCRTPYTSPTPCPRAIAATVPLDTRSLENGAHALRAIVRDAAGNRRLLFAGGFVADNIPDAAFDARVKERHLRSTRSGRLRFRRLMVDGLADEARVRLQCLGGRKRRCPFRTRTYNDMERTDKRNLVRKLRRRWLRPGAKIRVRVIGPDDSVRNTLYRVNRSKDLSSRTRCRLGGARKYERCSD